MQTLGDRLAQRAMMLDHRWGDRRRIGKARGNRRAEGRTCCRDPRPKLLPDFASLEDAVAFQPIGERTIEDFDFINRAPLARPGFERRYAVRVSESKRVAREHKAVEHSDLVLVQQHFSDAAEHIGIAREPTNGVVAWRKRDYAGGRDASMSTITA
jgi:hypothetical protein